MPTIQVLPPAESGAGLIAKALGQGLGSGLQQGLNAFYERQQNEKESTLVSDALKDLGPDAEPLEVIQKIISLPIRGESKKMYSSPLKLRIHPYLHLMFR